MQEGLSRLWRGTNASLALAIPSVGIYLPCYDVLRNYLEKFTEQHGSSLTPYSPLVAGSSARLLACVACYPIELARTRMQVSCELLLIFFLPAVHDVAVVWVSSVFRFLSPYLFFLVAFVLV